MKITKNDKYLQTVIFVILLCLSVRGGEGLMEDQIPFLDTYLQGITTKLDRFLFHLQYFDFANFYGVLF